MTMIERISPPTAATANTFATRKMKLPVRSRCWSFQFLVAIVLIYYQQVQAVFYKDICQTGPMYKVRIDPMTGKLVPVVQEDPFSKAEEDAKEKGGMVDGVYYNNGNPFASDYHDNVNEDNNNNNNNNNNENENDGLLTPNINRDSNPSNTIDDDPVGAIMIGNGIQTENENDQSSYEYEDSAQFGDGTRRVLRSNRIWREYETTESGDDDESSSTTQAIQIDAHYYDSNSKSETTTTIGRRLLETTQRWLAYSGFYDGADDDLMVDLQEGEFYVKPCLCESSRWTFPETAEPSLPKTVYNDTTDTIIQNVTNDTTATPTTTTTNSNNSPDDDEFTSIIGNDGFYSPNLGQHSSGQYILVPHNNPDADLYLCHVQAMYCGIPIDIDQDGVHAVCFDQNMRHIIARNAWPLILLWYFGLAVICCCTVHGRTAGDFVRDRLVTLIKTIVGFCFEVKYDFNDRMLDRMIEDDEEQRGRRRRGSDNTNTSTTTGNNNNNNNTTNNDSNNDNDASNNNNNNNTTSNNSRPWFYSNQRRQFERSLHAQVQWIWRHQEYLRELSLREQGLPPPQLKLKIKKFRMETTTSASREGGFGTSIGGNTNNNDENDNNEDDNDTTAKDAQQQQQQQQTPLEAIDTKRSIDSPKSTDKKPRRRGSFGSALRRNSNGSTSSRRNSNDSQRYGRRNSNDSQKSKKSKAKRRASGDALLKVLGIDKEKAASTPCTICPKEPDVGSPSSTDAEELEVVQINLTTPQDGQEDTDGLAKTTITIDDDDDVDSLYVPTCTICFCPFEEGDLIGDLSCKHEFHVECLKGWVQCKNACPLCNVRLGKPERPLPEDTLATETNNSNSNNDDDTAEGNQPGNSLRNVVRFLNTSYFQPRTTNNNSSSNDDEVAPGAGAGEIRRASRIGILGSVSSANDIAYAQTHRSTQRR